MGYGAVEMQNEQSRAWGRERKREWNRGKMNDGKWCSAPVSPRHGGIHGTEALSLGVVRGVPSLERSNGAEPRGEVNKERELGREGATGA